MINYTIIDNSLITDMNLSDGAYRLYNFMLSMCYGDKDTCYPSIAYLAEKLHRSVKTIGRNLKILKDNNLISSKRRGSISNLYTLLKKTMQMKADKLVDSIKGKYDKSKPKYTKKLGKDDILEKRNYNYSELENSLLGWDNPKIDIYGEPFTQSYIK